MIDKNFTDEEKEALYLLVTDEIKRLVDEKKRTKETFPTLDLSKSYENTTKLMWDLRNKLKK